MTDLRPTLKRLRSSKEIGFSDLIALYEEGFPECERKSLALLEHMLADDNYHFLLAFENGAAVGFVIVRVLNNGSATLLEYLAVTPVQRGRGLGRSLVVAITELMEAPSRPLLVEAESDREESPERALRTKRKQFYRSLGAREIAGLGWIMPQVNQTPPPPMELMIFAEEVSSISSDQLRQWITHIYVEVYEQNADDLRIDAMLRSIPDQVSLM